MKPRTKRRIGKAILGGIVATYIGLTAKYSTGIKIHKPYEELRKQGIPIAKSVNANNSGYCAAYAKDVASQVSKKRYPLGNAWDLPKKTRVISEINFRKTKKGFNQKEIENMITTNTITKGTLIGFYYPQSPNNKTNRPFTHIMVYVGEGKFAGNVKGPEVKTIQQIFQEKKFFPVCIMEPKN